MKRLMNIEQVRIDGGTQMRARIDTDVVAQYAEIFDKLPPSDVFHDGAEFWLADGFHRYHAAKLKKTKTFPVEMHKGTLIDAIRFAIGANAKHGQRRRNEDIAIAVKSAYDNRAKLGLPDVPSPAIIAEIAGITIPTAQIQLEKFSSWREAKTRTGKDGKDRPASRPVPPRRKPDDSIPAMPPPRAAMAPKPADPIDDVGRVIPEPLRATWARRCEPEGMLSALSDVKCALQKAEKERDQVFTNMHFQSVILKLEEVYHSIKFAVPYAVCGLCQGIGCKCCKTGLQNKLSWDQNVPAETKAMILRQIRKG